MSAYDVIYGNEQIKAAISGFSSRRAFPNAFMISGEKGSGKSLIAGIASAAIACEGNNRPCGVCSACKKIQAGISPDVITVTTVKDKKTIGIDQVREIRDSAYILPNDLSVKIYIIDEAERLTVQAQNALLKVFEEGPASVYFILLTSQPSALLPTVRSRAPELKTEMFSDGRLSELLLSNVKKASDLYKRDKVAFNRVISASGGSYGKALAILEGKNKKSTQAYIKAEKMLTALSNEDDSELLLGLISESNDREGYVNALRLIETGIRDMILMKKGEGSVSLSLFADEETATSLSHKFSLRSLVKLASVIDELALTAESTNINLRNAAIVAYNTLKEVK